MTIAVTAPSGNVGRHVVHDLVRAGIRPRVLAHRAESVDPAVAPFVDTRVTDLGEPTQVADALDGVEALFLVVPPNEADDPVGEYARVGDVVATAAEAAGVERVVLQSSAGAEKRHGAGEIDGLARVEERLDDSAIATLHLRCGFFFSNLVLQLEALRAGVVPVVLPTDRPMPWVAPTDIARVAAGHLLRPVWAAREVQAVHGPRDHSWDSALAVVTEATGHPVRAEQVSEDAMREILAGAGMGPGLVEAVLGMSTGLGEDFVPEQARDATTTTETTLSSWAYDVLRPLLSGSD